ncbi:MAG TPA: efflux RND transporter permease subunit [Bryobacteraceae bacterium]|nr:efflux RND transporter permease subunit [Bryobacteraceae bacterium]
MWIVRVALNRPYTFIVLALLILILSPIVILRTPTDIFPEIDIPVIAVVWNYTGMSAEEMEGRMTSVYERVLTTLVNNVEHIESMTVNGLAVVKIYLQPHASVDTATAQVTGASQTILRQMPPGVVPPLVLTYNASSVPILQLGLSSKTLSEQQLGDLGLNFIRTQLVTIPGASVPYPYGGKQRQVMIDLMPTLLQSKGISPSDLVRAFDQQNLILPAGTAKIGQFEYDVDLNASPKQIAEMNSLPVKQVGNTTIYLGDVAHVRDGFAPQTNIVRLDGQRGALVSILKTGRGSTLDIVSGARNLLPSIAATLPTDLKMQPLADQSIFVRAAVQGVIREAVIAAALTGLMILIFLGSWRSTLIIAVSIPLSILTSILVMSALGETINIMTLGGLALAVGILVDDATVEIENVNRNLEQGKEIRQAILDGAAQIAVPALVSTICICIVFLPMFFLGGVARYLFVPLAEAVVFAMMASYILSRTLVPTLAMYLLRSPHHSGRSRNPFVILQQAFESAFERLRITYELLLTSLVYRRYLFVPGFLAICSAAFFLVPWLGRDFFPNTDSGQFRLHLRTRAGTRIEETARLCDLVENSIRQHIPVNEMESILDNIGLPYSGINTAYSNSGVIGSEDADILVSLKTGHHPTDGYVRELRKDLANQYPGATFYFLPADMVTQILNFGLPAPIDVQVQGNDVQSNLKIADKLLSEFRQVPGLADLRIQQPADQPKLHITVDRTKASQAGLTQENVANSMLVTLSGSFQTQPTFWLNPQNGISYNVAVQAPQYSVQSLQDLQNIPIASSSASRPEILGDVSTISRGTGLALLSHYNIRRVVDVFGSVDNRDLGAVAGDINRIVDANRKLLPRGSSIIIRGQIDTMRTSYTGLIGGLIFAIVLVYLLIVVNFQSWLDPFIIITALPAALAGIVVFLFATHTPLSVPALMGSIMCMGVATANSILVVSFSKERLADHGDAIQAAIEAGFTRFRPVLMTALAMIIGMVPMALGMGEGGEQNAPLGRAVIGGLLFATVATLVFVPAVFSLLHGLRRRSPAEPVRESNLSPLHQ